MLRKTVFKTVAVLATLGAVSALAVAAGGGRHHWRHGGAGFDGEFGGGRHGIMRLARHDADRDGTVTLDEFLKSRTDRFTELDKNTDGTLDADELTASMREKSEHGMRMMLARIDADGDGKMTKDEMSDMRGHRYGRHGYGGRHFERGEGYGRGRGARDDDFGDRDDSADTGEASKPATPDAQAAAPGEQDDERGFGRHGRRGERHGRMFQRMDANSDGIIDKADLEARVGEAIAYAKRQRMHVLDKDKDGKVSKDEFTARPRQRFADFDLDGDGKITSTDLPPRVAERWQKPKAAPAPAEQPATGDKR